VRLVRVRVGEFGREAFLSKKRFVEFLCEGNK